MAFDEVMARNVAMQYCDNQGEEFGLVDAFVQVCGFLNDNQDYISWKSRAKTPLIQAHQSLDILAVKYFSAYRRSDFPIRPGTIPDNMASIVMMEAFGYSYKDSERIKIEHQLAMSAENCVGALLERYLDSVLRPNGWHWCCGSFVKAIDFIRRNQNGDWLALQIKNRDNSENSSSSAIRNGKPIQKCFRSYSRTGETNWANLPPLMQGFDLSEQGFAHFVRAYLTKEKLGSK
jgi:hypothetical protein